MLVQLDASQSSLLEAFARVNRTSTASLKACFSGASRQGAAAAAATPQKAWQSRHHSPHRQGLDPSAVMPMHNFLYCNAFSSFNSSMMQSNDEYTGRPHRISAYTGRREGNKTQANKAPHGIRQKDTVTHAAARHLDALQPPCVCRHSGSGAI